MHYPGKVVNLFEPHTKVIRRGKLAKPSEFGRRVKIQEADAQFVTDDAVCAHSKAERALWEPALDRHMALFDCAPQLAVAGGFASRTNERAAQDRGVQHVVLPRQSRDKRSRMPAPPFAGARGAKAGSAHSNAVMGSGRRPVPQRERVAALGRARVPQDARSSSGPLSGCPPENRGGAGPLRAANLSSPPEQK